jgi:hypothetical protein
MAASTPPIPRVGSTSRMAKPTRRWRRGSAHALAAAAMRPGASPAPGRLAREPLSKPCLPSLPTVRPRRAVRRAGPRVAAAPPAMKVLIVGRLCRHKITVHKPAIAPIRARPAHTGPHCVIGRIGPSSGSSQPNWPGASTSEMGSADVLSSCRGLFPAGGDPAHLRGAQRRAGRWGNRQNCVAEGPPRRLPIGR